MYNNQREDPRLCPSAHCHVVFRSHQRTFSLKDWLRKGWQDVWLVRRVLISLAPKGACQTEPGIFRNDQLFFFTKLSDFLKGQYTDFFIASLEILK